MRTLSDLLDEAVKINSKSLLETISQVACILKAEREGSGKFEIMGRLVYLPTFGRVIVIGDIHGDLKSLEYILTETNFLEKASSKSDEYLVFLGDYGDRGVCSPEVYYVVLSLKVMFPEHVVLLQGNHEGPEDLLAHPHDLPMHIERKIGGDWRVVYQELSNLFRQFYVSVLVNERCVMLHGGVPSNAKCIEDVAFAYEKHPAETHLEEILWSDPSDKVVGTCPSARGAGFIFGEDVTDAFLRMLNVHFVVRGHEPVYEGYKFNHKGKVLTLFSRRGPPYFNDYGAYLSFDLSETFDSARSLKPFIRKF